MERRRDGGKEEGREEGREESKGGEKWVIMRFLPFFFYFRFSCSWFCGSVDSKW